MFWVGWLMGMAGGGVIGWQVATTWREYAELRQMHVCQHVPTPFDLRRVDRSLAALSAAGLQVVPAGEVREELALALEGSREIIPITVAGPVDPNLPISYCGHPARVLRRTVHIGPWLPVAEEDAGGD